MRRSTFPVHTLGKGQKDWLRNTDGVEFWLPSYLFCERASLGAKRRPSTWHRDGTGAGLVSARKETSLPGIKNYQDTSPNSWIQASYCFSLSKKVSISMVFIKNAPHLKGPRLCHALPSGSPHVRPRPTAVAQSLRPKQTARSQDPWGHPGEDKQYPKQTGHLCLANHLHKST